ncbi:phosphotransferase system PTS, sorbose-specific IIC subunit [Lacticaseibacillus casei A2-362]|nr:phosphotransferase system PTS, sorbose-specific IIC subunit [Lacticaseibacillus casei A2-362]
MYNAIVVAIAVFVTVGGFDLIGMSMLYQPIVVGPLVGALLGDVQTGLTVGASLQAIFMGVVNVGGASSAEPGLATALSTAFAIILGGGLSTALPLALPLGVIGLQVKNLTFVAIVGPFASVFDRLAKEGKEKQITWLHFGLWAMQWFLYSLIPFFAVLTGVGAVKSVIGMIPQVVLGGLTVAGNLLPAVGMAMLLKILWDNKIAVFYLFGFLLVAYLNLPLIAVAAFALIGAILVALRDYQFKQLSSKNVPVRVGNGSEISTNETSEKNEEEDFFS